jgi:hypothetical protein
MSLCNELRALFAEALLHLALIVAPTENHYYRRLSHCLYQFLQGEVPEGMVRIAAGAYTTPEYAADDKAIGHAAKAEAPNDVDQQVWLYLKRRDVPSFPEYVAVALDITHKDCAAALRRLQDAGRVGWAGVGYWAEGEERQT